MRYILILAFVWFWASPALATTYYISPAGSDANDGLTADTYAS